MRVRLRVFFPNGTTDDIVVTADATASVGAIAAALARAQPALIAANTHAEKENAEPFTLIVKPPGTQEYSEAHPDTKLSESGISSGSTVWLARANRATVRTHRTSGTYNNQFTRPPTVTPQFLGHTWEAPTPPQPAETQRLPVAAMVAPAIVGLALYLATHNTLTLLFVALGPVMMLGSYADRWFGERARKKRNDAKFSAALQDIRVKAQAAAAEEIRTRALEGVDSDRIIAAMMEATPLLWSRRPDRTDFLQLTLGLGSQPSRSRIVLPPRGEASANHWDQLIDVRDEFADVAPVPVFADLRTRPLGIAGTGKAAQGLARALIAQVAALHSPAEVVIAAAIGDEGDCAGRCGSKPELWDWLKWIPHTESPHSPLAGPHLATAPEHVHRLITNVTAVLEERRSTQRNDGARTHAPAIVLLVEGCESERGRIVGIAEHGSDYGIHVVWVAARQAELPAACTTFAVLGSRTAQAAVGDTLTHEIVPIKPLTCGATEIAAAALQLAPIVDAGAPIIDESDLPRAIPLKPLLNVPEDHHEGITPADDGLRAVVGVDSHGAFAIDLRLSGPHALVGGTTGSGKSGFLQSWVISLAATYSPQRVTFLLVDYKGGAAFAECVDLPHTVGLVTDLSPHLVRRALTSLRAELRYREELLSRKQAKDLVTLERMKDPEAPPALVVVVDEFAALAAELPDFVDGIVDIGQRGRSLGLHLILATQRPAGVINENLRANTNLRIGLRMADESDSLDVLGDPIAAHFDPLTPGRAAIRTGPGAINVFQTGNAATAAQDSVPSIEVETLRFGAGEKWTIPPVPRSHTTASHHDGLGTLIATIKERTLQAGIPQPRKPWLPELPEHITLNSLIDNEPESHGESADLRLPVGLFDVPECQEQRTAFLYPERGTVAAIGAGGSGKSTFLRTCAYAAAYASDHVPWVYGLDYGGGGLAELTGLPHVGSIVPSTDEERVKRLLRFLAGITAAGSGDNRIFVLLDSFGAFRSRWEIELGHDTPYQHLLRISEHGRRAGIHLIMAAESPAAIPAAMNSTIATRIVLRQADSASYAQLGVPNGILTHDSPPGRAISGEYSLELQLAIAMDAPESMPAPTSAPPVITKLATVIPMQSTPLIVRDGARELPLLGIAEEDLQPIGFEPHGLMLLAGMPGSGRSNALAVCASALRTWSSATKLVYFGPRNSFVAALPIWDHHALTPDEATLLASELIKDILAEQSSQPISTQPGMPWNSQQNQIARHSVGIALVVESVTDYLATPAEQPLTSLFKELRRAGHFGLVEAETSAWAASWPLLSEVRNQRRGLVLQPDQLDGETLFRTSFGRTQRSDYPPGRGEYVAGGKVYRVQLPYLAAE